MLGKVTTLAARDIKFVRVKTSFKTTTVLKSILHMLKLQLNLINLSRLMRKETSITFAQNSVNIHLKSNVEL